MFIINDDKSIYITRGDAALFAVTAMLDGVPYEFQPNDVVRFKVFEKKGCDTVVLQKDFPVIEACDSVDISLVRADTKIGDIIHKPKDFWYEVELNPDTYPQTIIGYDEDGAKNFRLLPEGKDLEPSPDEEEQGTGVYERMMVLAGEMHSRVTEAVTASRSAAASAAAAAEHAESARATAESVREEADRGAFDGRDGITPHVGENGNWHVGSLDMGVPGNSWNLGDVIETTRVDMGDDWLRCDGEEIPDGELPELRDILPYNTDWRRLPPGSEAYEEVRPLPVEGQWLFMKERANYYDLNAGDTALVYDERTNTFTEIKRPTINGVYRHGIFGLTHDGEKYVLGVNAVFKTGESVSEEYYAYFYVSADLKTWTELLKYEITTYSVAYDMTYNGSSVVFGDSYSTSSGDEKAKMYFLDTSTKKVTVDSSSYTSEYRLYFQPVPNPYWCVRADNGESTSIRKGTAPGSVFGFSNNAKVAFFSDRFWIGYPGTRTYIADLTTETTTSFRLDILAGTNSVNLSTLVYDSNTREWCLHLSEYVSGSNSYTKYWLAYISEDADPREASNYRVVEVNELPSGAGATQMTPNRSRFRTVSVNERYIKNPNIKCLPTHDGDTYKYIYTRKHKIPDVEDIPTYGESCCVDKITLETALAEVLK